MSSIFQDAEGVASQGAGEPHTPEFKPRFMSHESSPRRLTPEEETRQRIVATHSGMIGVKHAAAIEFPYWPES